jgi:predicted acyltransferase
LGGLWGLFFGGLFITIPVVGYVGVLGYLATVMIAAIENAVVVGGLSALGASLYSIGVPKGSVIQYETALKADSFLLMAHGPAAEVNRAKTLLAAMSPSQLDVHAAGKAAEVLGNPAHAAAG